MKFTLVEDIYVADTSSIPRLTDDEVKRFDDESKSHKDVGKIVAFEDESGGTAYEVVRCEYGQYYDLIKVGSPYGWGSTVRTKRHNIDFADNYVVPATNNYQLDSGEMEIPKCSLKSAVKHLLKKHYKNVTIDMTKRPYIATFSEKTN